ncbi:MAG: alpha/beta hydrolase fold domain-containing protein [Bacteroidales bacterium]|nr:alpha/beta hydrolase fold domain-containing protein [Bacteroidales bacterium]
MIKTLLLSLIVSLAAVPAPHADKDYAVYLCIGQSNMAGRGEILEQDRAPLEGVYVLGGDGTPVPATAPLNRYSTIRKDLSLQGLGPCWAFAQKMHKVTGKKILLVVNAKGGTSIDLWLKDSPCDTHLVKNETWPDRTSAPQFYSEAVRRTKQAMRLGSLYGIIWHQGEGDSHTEEARHAYMGKLSRMVSDLRKDLKADVPFIAGEAVQDGLGAAINPVLRTISENIPKSACVTADGLSAKADGVHFNRESQIRLGGRYADAMLSLQYSSLRWEREPLWTKRNMPDPQDHQIAEMTAVTKAPDFNGEKFRIPYLEWFEAPEDSVKTGACMILISGGGYNSTCDMEPIRRWRETLTAEGIQCVSLVYRTPRPKGLPFYQTAWEDGQRAVRLVRSQASKRGYDPEKIGVISMSAGSHLGLLLASNSQTRAYAPVDKLDSIPCHINWGVLHAPAYVTTDGLGHAADRDGYGPDVKLDSIFTFDSKTCPLSLHHGENDPFSPNGSTLIYRELRRHGIPAELHLYPGKGHGVYGIERGVEFIRQLGFLGPLKEEVPLTERFKEVPGTRVITEDIWPEGKMPDRMSDQCKPYIEWHIPARLETTAIQIVYSGGGYRNNNPHSWEAEPLCHYLNSLGMTVVLMQYRTPRPTPESGLAKHVTAWEDLQRAIRVVRSEAPGLGLDPGRIGIMGSSAGGHLTVMGVTSSKHRSYRALDNLDRTVPCNVQWGIAFYPAYILTDGVTWHNKNKGNNDSDIIVPDFSFDLATAPMLMLHGDADGYSSMGSVKLWEKFRQMGVDSELHTYATGKHCFQKTASPGTGRYSSIERIKDFLQYLEVLPASGK